MVENSPGGGAVGEIDAVFCVPADVFEKTEKKNPDLHYVKAIKAGPR